MMIRLLKKIYISIKISEEIDNEYYMKIFEMVHRIKYIKI